MKQALLAVILIFTIGIKSWGQCTPSWPTGGGAGISPDSATNLPHAFEGIAYDATIQFKAPLDTLYQGTIPVIIDDITITGVTGLSAIPNISPFTYVPNPANGVFLGGSVSCINLTGTPSIGSAGTYSLAVAVTAHAHITGTTQPLTQSYTITYYKIVVEPNTSVPSISNSKFDLSQNFPNPFNYKTNISFNMPSKGAATFEVFDLIGNTIYKKYIDAKFGINTINYDASDLSEGVYFYSVSTGSGTLTRRLIVDRK